MLYFAQSFGLIIFVYALGLQVGPGFFSSLKKGGLELNLMGLSVIFIGLAMYKAIANATQLMKKGSGIDVIIPSGTALQNLRNTTLNDDPYDLTRDGYHSDLGAGRYVEACTWFLTLIKPCLSAYNIEGNTFRPTDGKVLVNNNNVQLIWKAAQKAVQNPYEISDLN